MCREGRKGVEDDDDDDYDIYILYIKYFILVYFFNNFIQFKKNMFFRYLKKFVIAISRMFRFF